jgi:predicted metal-dependent phosphoesterase TrpH
MEKRADLHVHTYYSDGSFSPEEAVMEARRAGLAAMAICDHDCIDGLAESEEAGSRHGIEVVPAVEMTAESGGDEIHILGYFIDRQAGPLADLLGALKKSRIDRIHSMIEKLRKHHVHISPEEVFGLSSRGTIGRMHLATALCNARQVSSVREAFNRYLADDAPCYVSRFNAEPKEVIGAILDSGGVPVYAHPGTMGRDDYITVFMKAGLRGLEVFHADHHRRAVERYQELATKYGLIMTGGSDCHGSLKGKVGSVSVPYATVLELKKESEEIKKARRV